MRTRFVLVVLILVGLFGLPVSRPLPAHADLSTFDGRRDDLLTFYDNPANQPLPCSQDNLNGKYGNWIAEAEYFLGHNADGDALVTDAMACSNSPSMFYWYAAIDVYNRFKVPMSASLEASLKTKFQNRPASGWDEGTTTNHKLMNRTAQYLAILAWPDLKATIDPTDEGLTFINCVLDGGCGMQSIVKEGYREADSSTYLAMYLTPFLALADYGDATIKNKAKLAYESLLANVAPEWLNGEWVASSYRIWDARNSSAFVGREGSISAWLYFGGTKPQYYNLGYDCTPSPSTSCPLPIGAWAIQSGVSSYRLPAEIVSMSSDRSVPFVHRESHEVNGGYNPNGWRNYRYITSGYGMASGVSGYTSGLWSDESMESVVRWDRAPYENNVFYVRHPVLNSYGNRGSSREFPNVQVDGTMIGVHKRGGTGQTGFESYLKGQRPSAGVTTIADRADPGATGKWIFFQGDNKVYVGAFLTGIYWYTPPPGSGDELEASIYHSTYFKSDSSKAAFVVETKPVAAYASLTAFADAITTRPGQGLDVTGVQNTDPQLAYTNLDGKVISIKYGTAGYRKLNGVDIDYTNWPLLHNPWLNQSRGGQHMVLSVGQTTWVYDWNNWVRTTSMAAQPTNRGLETYAGTYPTEGASPGWTISNWLGTCNYSKDTGSHTGTYAQKMNSPVGTVRNCGISLLSGSRVPVTAGKKYTLAAWTKAVNISSTDSTHGAYLVVRYYNALGACVPDPGCPNTESARLTGTSSYVNRVLTTTAPTGAATLYVSLRMKGTGDVYYDDVTVTEHD